MSDLSGQTIVIVGAGKSGQAAARLAANLGAQVKVSDQRPALDPEFLSWMNQEHFAFEVGAHTPGFITRADLVVASPGVRPHEGPVVWAREAGLAVVGEIEFAARYCPARIIAVTGSNGKTTVTTLIGKILKAAGQSVFVGGNIGHPLAQAVQGLTSDHWAVLELSSFQLQSIEQFHPHIAVWLNFSQNHLDYHADLNEYFVAKQQIFKNQTAADFAVLNAAESRFVSMAAQLAAQVQWFNEAAAPAHNPNHAAVRRVAQLCGVDSALCDQVLNDFRGVEHRMEYVATINAVDYINDSKSTTVESGRWALSQGEAPVVLICGGRDKGLDFTVLKDVVAHRVKKVIVFGEAQDKIARALSAAAMIQQVPTLEDALQQATTASVAGDVVLFSPMCASFDMFENFEHRGRVFKELVHQLGKSEENKVKGKRQKGKEEQEQFNV